MVLQSGEDDGLATAWVADVVRRIRAETPLAVTLSLGERPEADLAAWREAGADRYLLRFETANRALYDRIHPPRPGRRSDRLAILRTLRDLGYQIGSGVMVGIPGQTVDDLADDLETFRALDLDMIGLGPYLAHPATPLGRRPPGGADADQAPNTQAMTCKMLALARLLCPRANIPSTTALATLNPEGGRKSGLRRGANVVMPNLTPTRRRALYAIYPGKVCAREDPVTYHARLMEMLRRLGRTAGAGRGDSPRYAGAQAAGPVGG